MKHKKTLTSIVFFILGLIGLHAQENTTATGGVATGSGGTVAFSVGQVVYTANTNASGTVSQGVQQPYEIFTLGVKETELNISLKAFPNPTLDNLTLQISNYNNEKLLYKLYDMQGKLLNKGQIVTQQTKIGMTSLPTAIYFINVVNQQNKKIKTFKIIKN
ncbi:secreted protein with Por secretion system C-terminal sorting domain [Psychroflexus torquis ATCC 700755]|jgi:hypothetical protein|uniref:Secreted protein with Por secretion system C-terminal sorting domain n=1 Tax=Psychroflexus torquis (strain ATCC 700755 / CIP 106069 / ACAM 623) TaxID=313595 RepID=K4ILA2_PSYTT|nr:T9SS type A sorting domain-containing protein [Psychroflexus torquis]AFU70553.1 secreted protein with Por secretion system C-terminal sorting domain [Psychroflexus torquis ATCC 700755]